MHFLVEGSFRESSFLAGLEFSSPARNELSHCAFSLSLSRGFPVLRLQVALLVPRIHEMCDALSSREVASWLSLPVSWAVTMRFWRHAPSAFD